MFKQWLEFKSRNMNAAPAFYHPDYKVGNTEEKEQK